MDEFLELQKRHFILMEKKRVLISVYTNASGYLYQLMKVDGGTDLGWCEYEGDDEASGCFTSYNKALKHALDINELSDLEDYAKEPMYPWRGYTQYLIEKFKKK